MENSTNNTAVMTAEATTANKAVKAIGKVSGKIKKLVVSANVMALMFMLNSIAAFAEDEENAGVEQFETIIKFFADWIGRIGMVIGFVGAVMFGLAIKNDDADGKQRGLMTLAAGFIVFAITKALDMFGITGANP